MTHPVVVSVLLIGLFVAGCRQAGTPPPLREDPVLAAELQAQAAREKQGAETRKALQVMTLADAANLEAVISRNPEDLETRGRLLAFYRVKGKKLQSRDENLAAIRRHVAWVTQHHPDSHLLTVVIRRDEDPAGYAQIRELWKPHLEKPDASLAVLSLASAFFFTSEPEVAEPLLLRIQALPADPSEAGTIHDRALFPAWGRLAALYAQVIRAASRPDSNVEAAYADDVKARLAVSRDAPLLAAVAQALVSPDASADDDVTALGRDYLERAVAIDPDHPHVSHVRVHAESSKVSWAVGKLRGKVPASDADLPYRKSRLACVAEVQYQMAGGASEATRLKNARALAKEALAVATTLPGDLPTCDPAFRANLVLAAVAWREGDRQATLRYLADASKAPSPPLAALRRFPVALEGKLTNSLLKHGERETVAAYLEQASKGRTSGDRTRMLEEAAAIRDGRMPARYQRLLAGGHI